MLKSRGKSQDVVENKGQIKLDCTKTQDVVENKRVTRLTRDVYENKGLNTKSVVDLALECAQKHQIGAKCAANRDDARRYCAQGNLKERNA